MKAGDFAKICGVPVSVLRFYDSEGLLKPAYTDKYTGYRYYSESQQAVCARIGVLKSCGFTLAQIKQLLECENKNIIDSLFEARKNELENMLLCLEETQKNIMNNENNFIPYKENINLPFKNDEAVIGRWEVIEGDALPFNKKREVFFLPGGEGYWSYAGWTKGYLLLDDGCNTQASPYTSEQREDGLYMTVEVNYGDGGECETVILKKSDSKHYGKNDIRIIENTDLPFKNDAKVLGKWVAHDFIQNKSEFAGNPAHADFIPYFKAVEFLPDGECISVYGDEIISGDEQCWTKGYVLRKFNDTACAYEIKSVNGRDYLIVEWKSGDYRWGGYDTDYYVFVRS